MPFRRRLIAGELATAFAVLAVYMLVLLAPLHQAAGLQRSLALLGFESIHSWSVCTSVEALGDTDTPTAVKCPVTGVAKIDLAGPVPEGPFLHDARISLRVDHVALTEAPSPRHVGQPGQPRGPPRAA
jgi:hypothetical protein